MCVIFPSGPFQRFSFFSAGSLIYPNVQQEARETCIWQTRSLMNSKSWTWIPGLISTTFCCQYQTGRFDALPLIGICLSLKLIGDPPVSDVILLFVFCVILLQINASLIICKITNYFIPSSKCVQL